MGIPHLLRHGVRAALAEGHDELEQLVRSRGEPPETFDHIQQTIEAMPGLLVAVDQALSQQETPLVARTLFHVVISYLMQDVDLIPSHGDQPILGLLDDTYLLHRAAQELREHIDLVDMRSIDGGANLLAHILPRDVARALDQYIDEAKAEAAVLSSGH